MKAVKDLLSKKSIRLFLKRIEFEDPIRDAEDGEELFIEDLLLVALNFLDRSVLDFDLHRRSRAGLALLDE